MNENSLDNFRSFVQQKYMEHKDECRWYNIHCKYTGTGMYFRKHKWYLKKLYKEIK